MKKRVFLKYLFTFTIMAMFMPVFALGNSEDFDRAKELEIFQKLYSEIGGDKAVDGSSIIKFDIPEQPESGALVPIEIEIDHPMQKESYISKITVLTELNKIKHVITAHYTPQNGMAYLYVNAKLSMTQDIHMIAETNDGKIYAAKKKVKVAEGSCVEGKKMAEDGLIVLKNKEYRESDAEKSELPYAGYKPGETVKVIAILKHPMETGFRKDKYSGELKPKFYIQKITAFFEDAKIAEFDMDAAASKNPKVIFPYNIEKEGMLKVVYENNKGEIFEKSEKITPKSSWSFF